MVWWWILQRTFQIYQTTRTGFQPLQTPACSLPVTYTTITGWQPYSLFDKKHPKTNVFVFVKIEHNYVPQIQWEIRRIYFLTMNSYYVAFCCVWLGCIVGKWCYMVLNITMFISIQRTHHKFIFLVSGWQYKESNPFKNLCTRLWHMHRMLQFCLNSKSGVYPCDCYRPYISTICRRSMTTPNSPGHHTAQPFYHYTPINCVFGRRWYPANLSTGEVVTNRVQDGNHRGNGAGQQRNATETDHSKLTWNSSGHSLIELWSWL